MNEEQPKQAPPYVAFRTFTNFLDWLAEVGVPTRMDRTFWGQKLSGGYGAQLMAALRFLGLLGTDERPDPLLETMAKERGQRKVSLRRLLEDHYRAALDGLDLERATVGELQERFDTYGLQGATRRKAVAFFVHAAQYAELPLSTHITRKTKARKANGAKPRQRTKPRVPKQEPEGPKDTNRDVRIARWEDLAPAAASLGVQWLVQRLPKIGSVFTEQEREAWIQAAKSLFDIEYKKAS